MGASKRRDRWGPPACNSPSLGHFLDPPLRLAEPDRISCHNQSVRAQLHQAQQPTTVSSQIMSSPHSISDHLQSLVKHQNSPAVTSPWPNTKHASDHQSLAKHQIRQPGQTPGNSPKQRDLTSGVGTACCFPPSTHEVCRCSTSR